MTQSWISPSSDEVIPLALAKQEDNDVSEGVPTLTKHVEVEYFNSGTG